MPLSVAAAAAPQTLKLFYVRLCCHRAIGIERWLIQRFVVPDEQQRKRNSLFAAKFEGIYTAPHFVASGTMGQLWPEVGEGTKLSHDMHWTTWWLFATSFAGAPLVGHASSPRMIRRRSSRSICIATAFGVNSARWPPRSAGWTRSSSPGALAKTRQLSANACAVMQHGSASNLTRPRILRAAPVSARSCSSLGVDDPNQHEELMIARHTRSLLRLA